MKFETWKTIKLGTGLKTANDFRKALKEVNCHISSGYKIETKALLDSPGFSVASTEVETELVNISLEDLRLGAMNKTTDDIDNEDETRDEVYKLAQACGLNLCPIEVGPQLRLQYLDQTKNDEEDIIICMEPVVTKCSRNQWERETHVFSLYRKDDGLWLATYPANPDELWFMTDRYVFCKQRLFINGLNMVSENPTAMSGFLYIDCFMSMIRCGGVLRFKFFRKYF